MRREERLLVEALNEGQGALHLQHIGVGRLDALPCLDSLISRPHHGNGISQFCFLALKLAAVQGRSLIDVRA